MYIHDIFGGTCKDNICTFGQIPGERRYGIDPPDQMQMNDILNARTAVEPTFQRSGNGWHIMPGRGGVTLCSVHEVFALNPDNGIATKEDAALFFRRITEQPDDVRVIAVPALFDGEQLPVP